MEPVTAPNTAAAVVPEGNNENKVEQDIVLDESQQTPAAAPNVAPSPAAAAAAAPAPATAAARPATKETETGPSKLQPPQQQKVLPARTAKKTNDSKINK